MGIRPLKVWIRYWNSGQWRLGPQLISVTELMYDVSTFSGASPKIRINQTGNVLVAVGHHRPQRHPYCLHYHT